MKVHIVPGHADKLGRLLHEEASSIFFIHVYQEKMAARRHENVFFASRSEGYKIKIKKVSPKDVAKALYKFSGAQGLVESGKALSKCKPNDSKCIAKNLGNLALSGSGFIPGVGVAGRAASVARMAATTAKAVKAGKAAAGAAKAARAVTKVGGGALKLAGKAAGAAGDFVDDNAGELAGGAALLGAGALGAAALSRMGGGGGGGGAVEGGGEGASFPGGGFPGGGFPGGGFPGGGFPGGGGGSVYAGGGGGAPPIKINIQVSGSDMAASSGVFDEQIGIPQQRLSTTSEPEPEEEEQVAAAGAGAALGAAASKAKDLAGKLKGKKALAKGGGAKGKLAGRAAKMALTKGKSRFAIGPLADFAPMEQSVNWFAVIFIIVMAVLVLST
jgi:hypothetical protein